MILDVLAFAARSDDARSTLDAPVLTLRMEGGTAVATGAARWCAGGAPPEGGGGPGNEFRAEWSWDGRRLVATNDRYGFQPLFYSVKGDAVALSPSLVALARRLDGLTLDEPALAVFLRSNFLLGEDTPFREIKLVPPAATLGWEAGRISLRHERPAFAPTSLGRESLIEGYIELFREAVRRREPAGPIVVPLSGGRDSRHILFELCSSGRPPAECVTMRYYPSVLAEDAEVARTLCARVGVPHRTIDQPIGQASLEARKNVITHLSAMEHRWLLPLADYIAPLRATVYEGVAGDILSVTIRNTAERQHLWDRGDFRSLADEFLTDETYWRVAVPPELLGRLGRDVAVERMAAELSRHADAPNPMGSFLFWNRTRRVTALPPTSILGRVATVWCPFLDDALFDFLSTIPAASLLDHSLHSEVIARAYPQWADVPYAAKWPGRGKALRYDAAFWRDVLPFTFSARGETVRRSFLPERLARAAVLPRSMRDAPSFGATALYLLALEALLPGGSASAGSARRTDA